MRLAFSFLMALFLSPLFSQTQNGTYTLVVEGFDWGAAASRVILPMPDSIPGVNAAPFQVSVERSSSCLPEDAPNTSGERDIVFAYVSDSTGNHVAKGKYVTLILEVGP